MPTSNSANTERNESSPLSFSFMSSDVKVTVADLQSKVVTSLHDILLQRHDTWEKREILHKHGRLNFACPYCGDSSSDTRKKRGNIYTDKGFYFKCFNCGKYRNLQGFLRDFQIHLDTDELVLARELYQSAASNIRSIDPMMFLDRELLTEFGVERSEIEDKYNLKAVDHSRIAVYLQKRLQPNMSRFSWNEGAQQLYIFHVIPGTTKILGYQIRNFKSSPKYLTFKLSKIYEDLGKEVTSEVLDLDDISTTFGILELDLRQPVTVFEGPLDAFLYKNAAATCSSAIDFPIPIGNIRYMYDHDAAGKEASLKKISQGRPTFLWKKLLAEMGIQSTNKKIDLTDFLVYCKRNGLKVPKLSQFFSSDKYDIYYV